MKAQTGTRYRLAPGTQVREEDFGLLFYTMKGPRLYFTSSGEVLSTSFFEGKQTLFQWIQRLQARRALSEEQLGEVRRALNHLSRKGVILEC